MVKPVSKKVFWTDDEIGFLYHLDEALHSTLDLDNLFFIILTAATAGPGLSFSRAALFLIDQERKNLVGKMGIGPANGEEANRIWSQLAQENPSLEELFSSYSRLSREAEFHRLVVSLSLLFQEGNICWRSLLTGETYLLSAPYEEGLLPDALKTLFPGPQLVVTPIPGRREAVGVLLGDNAFSGRVINERQVQLLVLYAQRAGNILELIKTNQDLKEKVQELEEANRSLSEARQRLLRSQHLATIGQAIAYISHEIREPLSAIGGLAKVINRYSKDSREVKKESEMIYHKVIHLNRFLNRNLSFARFGEQRKRPCDIESLLKDTCQEIQKDLLAEGRKEVAFHFRLTSGTPRVNADPEQLQHALTNIIENSIYFITGLPYGKITLETGWNESFVEVKISDNGVGIEQSDLEKIFEPFYTTRSGGSGLGLAFARQIIEMGGGRISATSGGKGKGTTFTVFLPREKKGESYGKDTDGR